jgi:hypothetical protein
MLDTILEPKDFGLREQILVEMFNNKTLNQEFLLEQLNSKIFGVGTYCRWIEYLGLKDQDEPQYARQSFQNRIAT